jgi:ELWxxDGT repeat protein
MPSQLLELGGKLYFTAYTNAAGWELWSSDGTAGGTAIVKDINPGLTGSNPMFLRKYNNALYFNAVASPADGLRLWTSNGTAAGTVPANLIPGFTGYIPANFDVVNGVIYFESEDMEGLKLYRSDLTAGGTFVLGIQQNHQIMQLGEVLTRRAVVGNRVFFTAVTASNGNELYVTDGTVGGTHLVRDIYPGNNPFDPTPTHLVDLNGTLFFTTDDGVNGEELWISDGTEAGTVMVKDLR